MGNVDRRDFLKRSAVTGAGFALAPVLKLVPGAHVPKVRPAGSLQSLDPSQAETPLQAAQASQASEVLTPQVLWGAFAEPRGNQDPRQALVDLENQVGRRMGVHRDYQGMDSDIVGKTVRWLGERGTVPYRAFHAWFGSGKQALRWADIAAGRYDAWLSKQAADVAAWGKKMYICFHHEPEDDTTGNPRSQTMGNIGCGTSADYRAAYNHVRQVFRNATNLRWVAAFMSPTYLGNNGGPGAWMPSNFDIVGVDGYSRFPCTGNFKTFEQKFLPARRYADSVRKPMAIPEWGCVEMNSCHHGGGDALGKAKWITDAARTMKSWPQLIFVSYSNETDGPLNFRVTSTLPSQLAFAAAGKDPYFN